ncbi:hypothetical protein I4U23_014233 [Adineta vaga]|nr:hypothetical protein I4U23_014233 [Adineta vaga]
MSLCSCSSCLTNSSSSSSLKWSESNDSYRLLPSSSITTVSSQLDCQREQRYLTSDDDSDQQLTFAPVKKSQNCHIEKNISLQNQSLKRNSCILKAIMTKEQIIISDSLTAQSRIIPSKHISMKVVFHV